MAEHLELWTDRTPATPAPSGLDVDGSAQEQPPAITTRGESRSGRERGPFMTYLCLPWSYGDRERRFVWRRLQCRRRRHEMAGGHTVHLGGELVFIERRCRWCGAEPSASGMSAPC